jgi:hypothetical protein
MSEEESTEEVSQVESNPQSDGRAAQGFTGGGPARAVHRSPPVELLEPTSVGKT